MEKRQNYKMLNKYTRFCTETKLPVGEFECHKLNLNFEEIEFLVCNLKEVIETTEISIERDEIVSKLFELSIAFGLVGTLTVQEKDLKPEDFPCTAKYAESCFRNAKLLLESIQDLNSSSKRLIYINVLILCATHNQELPWSTENTINLSLDCLKCILESTGFADVGELLCSDNFHPSLLKGVFKKTRPWLLKNSWQNYPSSPFVFSWFLHHIKHPYLVDYLGDVFPPPCMFISDHVTSHQVLAIQCFHHILDNVPPTLISVDDKEVVVWSLLMPHVYSTEHRIIEELWPCLLKLPSFRFQKMKSVIWSRYDDALGLLLTRTKLESSLKVKFVYLGHVHSFIQVTPPFKHLKHLLNVSEESLHRRMDIPCRILSLKILKDVLKSCWPSMKIHCFRILKNICILLHNLENVEDNIENIQEIHDLCREIATYLKCICPEEYKKIVSNCIDNELPGVNIFKTVLLENEIQKNLAQ